MDITELLGDGGDDDETLALIEALSKQQDGQQKERAGLRDTLGRQQAQAGGLRALSLISSIGNNPLMRNLQSAAGEHGAQLESLAGRTEQRLGAAKGMDPLALVRLKQAQTRLGLKAKTDDERLALAKQNLERLQKQAQANAATSALKAEKKDATDSLNRESSLRKELHLLPEVKDFSNIKGAYRTLQEAVKDPSGAGGTTTIFSFMKMIDPGVAVMEGDVERIRAAGGPAAKFANLYQQTLTGNPLPESVRADLLRQGEAIYRTRKQAKNERVRQFRVLAQAAGVNPDAIEALEEDDPAPGSRPSTPSAPAASTSPASDIVMVRKPTGEVVPVERKNLARALELKGVVVTDGQ